MAVWVYYIVTVIDNPKHWRAGMKVHELANIFPSMEEDEFRVLRDDISENGQQVPIVTYNGKIIDGKHRHKACLELGIEPIMEEYEGGNPLAFVIGANLARRHLSSSQKAMIAAKLVTTTWGGDRFGDKEEVTTEMVSQSMGVSKRQVERGRRVAEKAIPVVQELVESGEVSVEDAADIAREPEEKQLAAVKKVVVGDANTLRSGVNLSEKEELKENPPELPQEVYRTLIIDPPWPITKLVTNITKPTETDIAYPTMSVEEIRNIDVRKLLHHNSHVFMWTTQKFLRDSFYILEQWGLHIKFIMVWHKPGGMQMPEYPCYNGEFVVCATMGSPKFINTKDFPVVFSAPRGAHSEKPERFYDIIRRVTPGPRLDMFNRRPIEGFSSWGNESEE